MLTLTDASTSILVAIMVTFVLSVTAITGAELFMRLLGIILSMFGVDVEG